ncbi:MAG: hypothetical protein MZV63_53750 [Marinilabiliales bacterium]|nr:hypothetical protein [Marinilabiliales bacterium]
MTAYSLALLGYTYGTNGIVVPPPAIVSYIDTLRAAAEIKKSIDAGADKTISIHSLGNGI